MLGYYQGAAARYRIPWVLLAGIGMEETDHWRNRHTSGAGAQGAMQFMPATFRTEGVDGGGDGRIDILDPADSVHSAARYLVDSGVRQGPAGVRKALLTYNQADWYVNDVLYYAAAYAAAYGAGTSLVATGGCSAAEGDIGQVLPSAAPDQVLAVLRFATAQSGKPYVMGGTGPTVWDCSGLSQVAYGLIGIKLPRTAAAQRDWLAAGHGTRIAPGQERPGDLIFWDSYLGPSTVAHVVIVLDPHAQTTIEAHGRAEGVGSFSYAGRRDRKSIFEIWRPAP
jgi:cell wall-associated NlpC family hydrolase